MIAAAIALFGVTAATLVEGVDGRLLGTRDAGGFTGTVIGRYSRRRRARTRKAPPSR